MIVACLWWFHFSICAVYCWSSRFYVQLIDDCAFIFRSRGLMHTPSRQIVAFRHLDSAAELRLNFCLYHGVGVRRFVLLLCHRRQKLRPVDCYLHSFAFAWLYYCTTLLGGVLRIHLYCCLVFLPLVDCCIVAAVSSFLSSVDCRFVASQCIRRRVHNCRVRVIISWII